MLDPFSEVMYLMRQMPHAQQEILRDYARKIITAYEGKDKEYEDQRKPSKA